MPGAHDITYVVAGRADCPFFAKAEKLANYLSANLPNVKVEIKMLHPRQWNGWLRDICQKLGFWHDESPLIFEGTGRKIGGVQEFAKHIDHKYGLVDESSIDLLRAIGRENMELAEWVQRKHEVDRYVDERRERMEQLRLTVQLTEKEHVALVRLIQGLEEAMNGLECIKQAIMKESGVEVEEGQGLDSVFEALSLEGMDADGNETALQPRMPHQLQSYILQVFNTVSVPPAESISDLAPEYVTRLAQIVSSADAVRNLVATSTALPTPPPSRHSDSASDRPGREAADADAATAGGDVTDPDDSLSSQGGQLDGQSEPTTRSMAPLDPSQEPPPNPDSAATSQSPATGQPPFTAPVVPSLTVVPPRTPSQASLNLGGLPLAAPGTGTGSTGSLLAPGSPRGKKQEANKAGNGGVSGLNSEVVSEMGDTERTVEEEEKEKKDEPPPPPPALLLRDLVLEVHDLESKVQFTYTDACTKAEECDNSITVAQEMYDRLLRYEDPEQPTWILDDTKEKLGYLETPNLDEL